MSKEDELKAEIEQLKARLASVEQSLGTRTVQSRSEIYNNLTVQGSAIIGGDTLTPPPPQACIEFVRPQTTQSFPTTYTGRMLPIQPAGLGTEVWPYWSTSAGWRYGMLYDRTYYQGDATWRKSAGTGPVSAYNVLTGFAFPAATNEYADHDYLHAPWFSNNLMYAAVFWAGDAAGAGNVVWQVDNRFSRTSTNITTPTLYSSTATTASGGQWILNVSYVAPARWPNYPSFYGINSIRVNRLGANAADTYAGNAIFLGLQLITIN